MLNETQSNHIRETLLKVRHRGCPASDTSAAYPAVHLENLSKTQIVDGLEKRLFRVEGDPPDVGRFADAFRTHALVDSVTLISERSEGRLCYFSAELDYDEENPSILSLVNQQGCYQHSTVKVRRGWEHWLVTTEGTDDVRELVSEIEQYDNDVIMARTVDVGELSEEWSTEQLQPAADLTTKQREAFEAALSCGYYEAGTNVTIEDIAIDLNLHQSTVWEHIKKAEDKILSAVGEQLFDLDHRSKPVLP